MDAAACDGVRPLPAVVLPLPEGPAILLDGYQV